MHKKCSSLSNIIWNSKYIILEEDPRLGMTLNFKPSERPELKKVPKFFVFVFFIQT